MAITFKAIGTVQTDVGAAETPRHSSVSDVEGWLNLLPEYEGGLADIQPGQQIVVLFHFHESAQFSADLLRQTPPRQETPRGVFSICSPRRPNAIGMSVVQVQAVAGSRLRVKGLDMYDGTPILDIKPYRPFEAPSKR